MWHPSPPCSQCGSCSPITRPWWLNSKHQHIYTHTHTHSENINTYTVSRMQRCSVECSECHGCVGVAALQSIRHSAENGKWKIFPIFTQNISVILSVRSSAAPPAVEQRRSAGMFLDNLAEPRVRMSGQWYPHPPPWRGCRGRDHDERHLPCCPLIKTRKMIFNCALFTIAHWRPNPCCYCTVQSIPLHTLQQYKKHLPYFCYLQIVYLNIEWGTAVHFWWIDKYCKHLQILHTHTADPLLAHTACTALRRRSCVDCWCFVMKWKWQALSSRLRVPSHAAGPGHNEGRAQAGCWLCKHVNIISLPCYTSPSLLLVLQTIHRFHNRFSHADVIIIRDGRL